MSEIWDTFIAGLGEGWSTYALGDDWRVLVSDEEDPILCEVFESGLGNNRRVERIAYFDQGWVVTKRGARISPEAMRALLDAEREA